MPKPSSAKSALLKRLDETIRKNELAYVLALREWKKTFSLREPSSE